MQSSEHSPGAVGMPPGLLGLFLVALIVGAACVALLGPRFLNPKAQTQAQGQEQQQADSAQKGEDQDLQAASAKKHGHRKKHSSNKKAASEPSN